MTRTKKEPMISPTAMPLKKPTMPSSVAHSRRELLNMIGRLRAAALIDLPDLSEERQNVVRNVLETTKCRNDEGDPARVTISLDQDEIITLSVDDTELDVEGSTDTYAIIYAALVAAQAGAAIEEI